MLCEYPVDTTDWFLFDLNFLFSMSTLTIARPKYWFETILLASASSWYFPPSKYSTFRNSHWLRYCVDYAELTNCSASLATKPCSNQAVFLLQNICSCPPSSRCSGRPEASWDRAGIHWRDHFAPLLHVDSVRDTYSLIIDRHQDLFPSSTKNYAYSTNTIAAAHHAYPASLLDLPVW